MSSRNFISIAYHLPSFFLSSFPSLSLFLSLLFLLFLLLFPDFWFSEKSPPAPNMSQPNRPIEVTVLRAAESNKPPSRCAEQSVEQANNASRTPPSSGEKVPPYTNFQNPHEIGKFLQKKSESSTKAEQHPRLIRRTEQPNRTGAREMMSNWTEQRAIFGCSVRSAPCSVLGNVERGTLNSFETGPEGPELED